MGVLVFGFKRLFAMEGAVNAGYGVIGQSILLLWNAWPKTLQVLQVFKRAEPYSGGAFGSLSVLLEGAFFIL